MSARSTLERAFELARSGECRIVGGLVARLKAEGYRDIDHHLSLGRGLRDQLARLCKEAYAKRTSAEKSPAGALPAGEGGS